MTDDPHEKLRSLLFSSVKQLERSGPYARAITELLTPRQIDTTREALFAAVDHLEANGIGPVGLIPLAAFAIVMARGPSDDDEMTLPTLIQAVGELTLEIQRIAAAQDRSVS